MSNSGNFVNRIGLAHRHRNMAICVAVVAIIIAWMGWNRKINIVAERPVFNNTDCTDWCVSQQQGENDARTN